MAARTLGLGWAHLCVAPRRLDFARGWESLDGWALDSGANADPLQLGAAALGGLSGGTFMHQTLIAFSSLPLCSGTMSHTPIAMKIMNTGMQRKAY